MSREAWQTGRKARSAILAGILGFAALQIALDVLMDTGYPELRDPEYGYKLRALRSRLAAEPGRPLMLILASSRGGMGISPQAVENAAGSSVKPGLIFNFSCTGAGPLFELVMLRRLLAEGIRPDWLVIEVLPPLLSRAGRQDEIAWLNINRFGSGDLPFLFQYTREPAFWLRRWIRSRLTPAHSHRFAIMSRAAPDWLAWDTRQDGWHDFDAWGWQPFKPANLTAEQQRKAKQRARDEYAAGLAVFAMAEDPERALRELLDLCRHEQIAPFFLLMPEGSEFRSWYPPQAMEMVLALLNQLSREYQAPVIYARDWLPDEAFWDGHHMNRTGAVNFSTRLGRDVLRPVFEARSIARRGQATAGLDPR